MNYLKRFISAVLSFILVFSLCIHYTPIVSMAAQNSEIIHSNASIALTINFDLPQTIENVKQRDIKLKLTKDGETATISLNGGQKTGTGFPDAQIQVRARNKNGIEMTTETLVGCYDVMISDLEIGNYHIELSGEGCVPFTKNVSLQDYCQYIVVSTANGSFSLGDMNNDGVVNSSDRIALSKELGQKNSNIIYDLNGDGIIDISDLAYVNRAMGKKGEAEVYETETIVGASIEAANLNISGNIENLFNGKSNITFSGVSNGDIIIPITFQNTSVEMSQIVITSPYGTGSPVAGTATVELEDGTIEQYHFDNEVPKDVHAIGASFDKNTITINLGKKVAVKKVTIKVTKVTGQDGKPQYVTVSQIQFLKDVIVDDAQNVDTKVRNVVATASDSSVLLKWNAVSNVTSYIIHYGTEENNLNQSVTSNVNSVTVSGLKNLTKYYFQVTATNGDWHGTASDIVSATPQAASIPGAPSNIQVVSAKESLRVSWGKTKDAAYYQVFYRKQGDTEWIPFGGNTESTSSIITGLTNGTTYEIAIKAGNSKGVGPYSAIATGIPKSEDLEQIHFPTDGRIDNSEIESVVMADPSNVDKTLCPNFDISHVIDGDVNTYWVARHYSPSSKITYTFKTAHDMNYLLFAPYLSQTTNHKNVIARYGITAQNSAGNVILQDYKITAPRLTANNYIIAAFPELKDVKSITVQLDEKEGGGARVSVSEIAFYNSDDVSGEIAQLFADNTFTTLNNNVTQSKIDELSVRLEQLSDFYMNIDLLKDELNLAQSLFNHDTSQIGIVKNDFSSYTTSSNGQGASNLQPIGISALAPPNFGESAVAIYANIPQGETVSVVPTQYYGESGVWKGSAIPLKNGRNYISIPRIGSLSDTRGGMLYITYSGNNASQIKLHVRESDKAFKIPVLELSNWYDLSEDDRKAKIRSYIEELEAHVNQYHFTSSSKTDIKNATEISTPSVLLSLPVEAIFSALKGVGNNTDTMIETMYQNILAWEEVIFVANKVQGIIPEDTAFEGYQNPMTTRQNIRYMRMFAGAFMYAAGNHVGIEYGSAGALACGRPTTSGNASLFGWGIAHEIGHNMDKLGKAEITNNIYSLAVQAWNGSDMITNTRLTNSNKWKGVYDKVSVGRPGAANDVFVQLGMYWQLHLAYDTADNPLGFYNAFFKKWKAGEHSGKSYDDRVALIASEVTDKNLTEFFTRWGMTLSADTKSTLATHATESRAIWYLNDESYNIRLSNGSANVGTIQSVTATTEGNNIKLTIDHTGQSNLLGYEITRNGVTIGFTTENTYTDNVGAANNRTYTYTVIPVDKLGNRGSEEIANEVRVAYDKTIDSNLYTSVIENGKTIITMKKDAVAVTGIKANSSGTATIKVKADASHPNWTTVKASSNFDANTPVYFNKPDADASDTRIWTYDVAVMEIEGNIGDIELLDYPGDRIDFYTYKDSNNTVLPAIGVMKSNYENIIKAGTLVIVGTYRGNPAYALPMIEARYTTTPEGQYNNGQNQETTIVRPMNGDVYVFAEIPKDGAVSDTSDGLFLFVPDMTAEKELNEQDNVTDDYPEQIRMVMKRTDSVTSDESSRTTSETLWMSFPDPTVIKGIIEKEDGTIETVKEEVFPYIEITSDIYTYIPEEQYGNVSASYAITDALDTEEKEEEQNNATLEINDNNSNIDVEKTDDSEDTSSEEQKNNTDDDVLNENIINENENQQMDTEEQQ